MSRANAREADRIGAAMAHSHLVALLGAAALLLCLVGRASGQVPVNVTAFRVTPQVTVYGTPLTYGISLFTPASQPSPSAGTILFGNASAVLVTFPITSATSVPSCTTSGCTLNVSLIDTGTATGETGGGTLSAGLYNAVSASYSGGTANSVTWAPATSIAAGLPLGAFQVLPASVEFTTRFTPFTLSNFTAAISVNLTNLNLTNVPPAGTAYGAFYQDPMGANTLIGNYSLILTPKDANTVKLDFPSNFNPQTLFTTTGSYRLIETYFPTSNFTQPQPLVIGFTVTTTAPSPPPPPGPPASPPPPLVPPPPPPPGTPGTGQKTTISLAVHISSPFAILLHPSDPFRVIPLAVSATGAGSATATGNPRHRPENHQLPGCAHFISLAIPSHPSDPLESFLLPPPPLLPSPARRPPSPWRSTSTTPFCEFHSVLFCGAAQIYFNYAKKRRSLLADVASAQALGYAYTGCSRSGTLTFVSAVKGTTGVPADGTVTITLQPYNKTIGTATVVPNTAIGASTATITRPFIDGATYGYGTQSATATYSGSTDGIYLPASVTVPFTIPPCQSVDIHQDIVNKVVDTVHAITGPILISGDGYGSTYGYGSG
ncbi:hypothetical protein COCOBI_11-5540 [Coccomyxa sp. Obi]|nr:hypothetical protein COCOBI_11-5540 [Coccomyxa sp. Obi]